MYRPPTPEQRERFESRVHKTPRENGCWLWNGNKDRKGYGTFTDTGNGRLAHRIAYSWHHQVKITPDQIVMHTCDYRSCVRPESFEAWHCAR